MSKNPSWWNDEHTSAWERTKEALRRDWEQTKADVGAGGKDLHQGVGDTIKQAAGKEGVPRGNTPNETTADWAKYEPALRYGYVARRHYATSEWGPDLESKLERDWDATEHGTTWEQAKNAVRHGWEGVRRAL